MPYTLSVAGHIVIGSAAILFYWIALLSIKGSPRHKAWGRVFMGALVVVALSVGPVLLLRPGIFDPARVVQFIYIDLCLITVVTVGWTAIRWKSQLERFRGLHFRALGATILALGLVVLLAGLASRNPVPVTFSLIGLVYGSAMIRFAWMRAEVHPRWWLGWHLNAVCGLFNATHGTVLAVAWRALADPDAGDLTTVVTQLGTMAVALAMRLWLGHVSGAPLRLARPFPVNASHTTGVTTAAQEA
jgi:hypothetical protein